MLSLGFGFTFLITAPLTTTLMGRMYGFASIGLLSGFVTTVHHLGGGLWAYLGGAVYDATGELQRGDGDLGRWRPRWRWSARCSSGRSGTWRRTSPWRAVGTKPGRPRYGSRALTSLRSVHGRPRDRRPAGYVRVTRFSATTYLWSSTSMSEYDDHVIPYEEAVRRHRALEAEKRKGVIHEVKISDAMSHLLEEEAVQEEKGRRRPSCAASSSVSSCAKRASAPAGSRRSAPTTRARTSNARVTSAIVPGPLRRGSSGARDRCQGCRHRPRCRDTRRMTSRFDMIDARLRRLPDWTIFAGGMAVVAAVAAFKITVGHDIPVADFLLIPVAIVGWLVKDRAYAYVAAACTAAVSVAIAVAWQAQAPLAAALAAAGVRFVLYLVVLALLGAIRRMQEAREKEATTDYLTGAVNARAFEEAAAGEIERTRRYGRELSLLYLDVDDFKADQRHVRARHGRHACSPSSATSCVARCAPTTWWHASAATSSPC